MSHALGTRRTRRGVLKSAAVGGALFLTAACGSTIPLDDARMTGGGSGDGFAVGPPGEERGGPTDGVSGGPDGSAAAAGGGGGSGNSGRTSGPGGSSGRRTTTTRGDTDGGKVRGVSVKTIRIGIEYVVAADSVGSSFGAESTSRDWREDFQIVVDSINARGGIHGRQVKAEYFGYRFEGDWATQERAACEKFVRDVEVFAVVAFAHGDAGLSCYEEAGIIQIVTGAFAWFDERTFRTYPHLMQAGGFSLDRLFGPLIDHLHARGFFTPGAKIGVVSHETPQWKRATNVVRQRLAKYGLSITYLMELPEFHTAGDGEKFARKLNTEIVNMRESGVTHVVFVQQTITGALLFMSAAEGQVWRPKYGISTNDAPDALASYAPRAQVANAIGAGFSPWKDVAASVNPSTPGTQRCVDIFMAEGVSWRSYSEKNQSLQRCDHVLTLEAAIAAGGQPISPASTLSGLGKLGTSYQHATTWASNYGNGRRDGATEMRGLAYSTECNCFRYVTEPFHVP